MAHAPHHKAAPQHTTSHDDPMALDIDSLLQHTEDTDRHRDPTPPASEPIANDPADPYCAASLHSAPPRPPPHEQVPWTHLSNAMRRHHPTHKASKRPTEYWATVEHNLPDITGQGLNRYITVPSLGTPTQEWEEESAVDVTDMTACMESVDALEQDSILSLLAYCSWRWGHQVTPQQARKRTPPMVPGAEGKM